MRRHGTPSNYNHGCRCAECTAANTERQKRTGWSRLNKRARAAERVEIDGRMVHPDPYGGHGSLTAYTSCYCRCGPCCEAARLEGQARRKRRVEATS